MIDDIARILFTEEQIQARIAALGRELANDYAGKNPLFIGILKGVVVFFADMIRMTPIPCGIDFMSVSSYGGTSSTGNVIIQKDLTTDIAGRHVVVLEDILDTGLTLKSVAGLLRHRQPASLRICTLLDKPDRRQTEIAADYVGFQIPNEFVVGYGLDYNEQYRNLPFIGILKPEIYEK